MSLFTRDVNTIIILFLWTRRLCYVFRSYCV